MTWDLSQVGARKGHIQELPREVDELNSGKISYIMNGNVTEIRKNTY